MDAQQLEAALDAQRRSYALLQWLAKGKLPLDQGGHICRSSAKSAASWVERHYGMLPDDCRPASQGRKDTIRFANILASYLETSFEWSDNPRPQLKLGSCG